MIGVSSYGLQGPRFESRWCHNGHVFMICATGYRRLVHDGWNRGVNGSRSLVSICEIKVVELAQKYIIIKSYKDVGEKSKLNKAKGFG